MNPHLQGTPITREYFTCERDAYFCASKAITDGRCVQVYCAVPGGLYLVESCEFRPVAQEFPAPIGAA